MKTFIVFLVTIFFSSFSYAVELLDLTDSQKKAVMASYKDETTSTCFSQFSARFDRDNRIMSEKEKTFGKQFCSCVTEKITDIVLDDDINYVKEKMHAIAANSSATNPIVDECVSQSRK